MPTPPRNGMVVVPTTSHLSMALYQCKVILCLLYRGVSSIHYHYQDGYELEGDNTTTCMFGNWTGTTPACVTMYCRFPGYLPHGEKLVKLQDIKLDFIFKVKSSWWVTWASMTTGLTSRRSPTTDRSCSTVTRDLNWE